MGDERTVIFCDPDPVLNFKTQSKSNQNPKTEEIKKKVVDGGFDKACVSSEHCSTRQEHSRPTLHLGSEQKGRVSLLRLAFSSRLASLLLRWKTDDTVFVVL